MIYSVFTVFIRIFISLMCIVLFVQTADNHLGRVDITSLSDQTLMEMLVERVSERMQKRFQDNHGMFRNSVSGKE